MTRAPLAPTMIGDQRNVSVVPPGDPGAMVTVDDLREPSETSTELSLHDDSERGHWKTRDSQISMRKVLS